jgi:hypothetical protein
VLRAAAPVVGPWQRQRQLNELGAGVEEAQSRARCGRFGPLRLFGFGQPGQCGCGGGGPGPGFEQLLDQLAAGGGGRCLAKRRSDASFPAV